MDDLVIVQFVKTSSFFIGVGGLIFGLDAVLGAHLTSAINTFLSKAIDLDKIIIGHPKRRMLIGIAFLAVSAMAFLIISTQAYR